MSACGKADVQNASTGIKLTVGYWPKADVLASSFAYFSDKVTKSPVKSEVEKLLERNRQLNHLEMAAVVSHVQRETDGWVLNTIMLDGYDVPFRYRRKKRYRSLKGARINITYYLQLEQVAGTEVEVMKVVRLKRS